jgi:uncharacterized membrane protein
MEGSLATLAAATSLFVGGHFVLSTHAVRAGLVDRLGERGFLIAYSAIAVIAFVWMLTAYGRAAVVPLWNLGAAGRHVPLVVMPFALILAVAGITTPSPTAVGRGETTDTADPAPGILRITRHPFLWGVALWAASHLVANGDLASLILMGGLMVLALGGMVHIDARRAASMGSRWGPFALVTSRLPFAALLAGRCQFDWAGIGLWRLALALGIYVVLLYLHGPLIGVSAVPGG